MKITVFTSNQPRHYSLINALASRASEVFAVQECLTLFPGRVPDFYKRSDVMQRYFSKVIAAEHEVFPQVTFAPSNVRTLSLKAGDLNMVSRESLAPAMQSDVYIVFGGSFIKSPLIDALIDRNAINIHMGVSPYYRGAACNFWAVYDGNADLVGATIHKLSRGLDDGDMLFHAFPAPKPTDPFLLGMLAVRAAHRGLLRALDSGELLSARSVKQDAALEIRYTRNREFTDEVASEYLARTVSSDDVGSMFARNKGRAFINPFYDS